MFTTPDEVKKWTTYEVTAEDVVRAQTVVEAYVGRVEEDIVDVNDLSVLARATAFQAAYMKNDYERVYEQVALVQIVQTDGAMTMDRNMAAPFIAPLAVLALRALSWKRSRSVKTGSLYGVALVDGWETA